MDSPKKAPELADYDSLGVTDFYVLPHYTNAPFKKIVQKIIEEYESKLDLRPISNNQVIIVNGQNVALKTA
jgi:dipeptidase E